MPSPRTVPLRLVLLAAPLLALLMAVLIGCGGDSAPQADAPADGDASGDVRWGDGSYGVVLAHGAAFDAASWQEQAVAIAEQGASVVAVEDLGEESLLAAVETLRDEGIDRVALVGGSAGADAILSLSSQQPDLADQLILLSPNSVVEGLGDQPKLFVASAQESVADVSRELATASPGDDNVALILPGSAHAQNIFDTDQGPRVLSEILTRLAAP